MSCSTRTPLRLFFLAGALAAPSVLRAQQTEVFTRRLSPTISVDSTERVLRRLERTADSLARLYNDADDLSSTERRRIGMLLDRTVGQIQGLSMRLAELAEGTARAGTQMRITLAPTAPVAARAMMQRALTEAQTIIPRGWLGIVVSGVAREPWVENGELLVRYLAHPEIVSVDPSSPAERAGLVPSDTLIAYDGRDVRDTDISLTRLLKPNSRVLVRIRRDGRTRDVPVTIADVPSRISLQREMTFRSLSPRATMLPTTPRFPRTPAPAPMSGSPPAAMAVGGVAPMPPMQPTPSAVFVMSVSGVAGAQLVAVTEGLARSLGVQRGVLVTNSPAGSPAFQSGLRDGDVIVKVGDADVRTIADVREQVASAAQNGDHTIVVQYVRDRRTQRLTLRWDR